MKSYYERLDSTEPDEENEGPDGFEIGLVVFLILVLIAYVVLKHILKY